MLNEQDRSKCNEIMRQMQCSKSFMCIGSDFGNLCRARDLGPEDYVECLEDYPALCEFSSPFGNIRLCKCELRVYIAKKLKK